MPVSAGPTISVVNKSSTNTFQSNKTGHTFYSTSPKLLQLQHHLPWTLYSLPKYPIYREKQTTILSTHQHPPLPSQTSQRTTYRQTLQLTQSRFQQACVFYTNWTSPYSKKYEQGNNKTTSWRPWRLLDAQTPNDSTLWVQYSIEFGKCHPNPCNLQLNRSIFLLDICNSV